MRKTIYYFLILFMVLALFGCTFHIPYEVEEGYRGYRVVLVIEPDDAKVLLNGRYIGDAYEFSTPESALRLSSRRNEIIIKKEGFIEEVVDLYEYTYRHITINRKLREDKGFVREAKREKVKRAPTPKTVKEKVVPEEAEEEVKTAKVELIKLTLEIDPAESSIYLNGKFWGISPAKGKIENLRLKPGKYTLEIVKPGYQPYKKELNLKDQEELKLTIKLIK